MPEIPAWMLETVETLESCPECGEGWPDGERVCPACGVTIEQVAEKLAGEGRRYGPGNPDWERDIEREYERG